MGKKSLELNWRSGKPIRNPDFAFRQIDDEGLLMPIRTNVVEDEGLYSINPIGTRILLLMDGNRTGDEIVTRLEEEYDVTREQLEKDVELFISTLINTGSLEVRT